MIKLKYLLQETQMKHKDERAKLTSAFLSDIKVIKLYGWEKTFMEKVLGIRKQELQALKRSQILFSASLASFHSSTFLVSGSLSYIKHALLLPFLFALLPAQIFHVGQLKIVSAWSIGGLTGVAESQWNKPHRCLHCHNSSMDKSSRLAVCSRQTEPAVQEPPEDLMAQSVATQATFALAVATQLCVFSMGNGCAFTLVWLQHQNLYVK